MSHHSMKSQRICHFTHVLMSWSLGPEQVQQHRFGPLVPLFCKYEEDGEPPFNNAEEWWQDAQTYGTEDELTVKKYQTITPQRCWGIVALMVELRSAEISNTLHMFHFGSIGDLRKHSHINYRQKFVPKKFVCVVMKHFQVMLVNPPKLMSMKTFFLLNHQHIKTAKIIRLTEV